MPNNFIPVEVLTNIQLTQRQGNTFEEAVTHVRGALVPAPYQPYPFREHVAETHLDRMRTVVATYKFRHEVASWKAKGVDFTTYLYVPEIDQTTEQEIHERGDHSHLLKRMAQSTRELKNADLNPDHYDAALMDRTTGEFF